MALAHLFQSALALSDLDRFYGEVRHTSESLGEHSLRRGRNGAVDARCDPCEVAPRAHDLVF